MQRVQESQAEAAIAVEQTLAMKVLRLKRRHLAKWCTPKEFGEALMGLDDMITMFIEAGKLPPPNLVQGISAVLGKTIKERAQ